jgi:glycosyltransferase involved in cell wall biosynthesis
MRIVSIAHAYPRWDGDVAGAFVERLAVALQRRGHRISVIVPADRGSGGETVSQGVAVRRVRYSPANLEVLAYTGQMVAATRSFTGMTSFGALLMAQAMAAITEATREPVDLIHAHWWVPGGVAGWLTHLAKHRPYVVTLHGTDVALLERSSIGRRLARTVLRRASAVTAVSSYLAERAAEQLDFEADRIVVQPMPLDVDRYNRRSAGGGGIVTVGRLVQQKRVGTLLEAVARLRTTGHYLPLKIIGDGPERRALEYHAMRLGIGDTTEFVGQVSPDAIPDAIGDADVFAFPAVGEGFGLAAAEALMLGVPVVALRSGGGVADVVPSEGAGRLVSGDSPGELAVAIAAVVADPQSRQQAAELGTVMRKRFSPDGVAAVFERVYAGALEMSP